MNKGKKKGEGECFEITKLLQMFELHKIQNSPMQRGFSSVRVNAHSSLPSVGYESQSSLSCGVILPLEHTVATE